MYPTTPTFTRSQSHQSNLQNVSCKPYKPPANPDSTRLLAVWGKTSFFELDGPKFWVRGSGSKPAWGDLEGHGLARLSNPGAINQIRPSLIQPKIPNRKVSTQDSDFYLQTRILSGSHFYSPCLSTIARILHRKRSEEAFGHLTWSFSKLHNFTLSVLRILTKTNMAWPLWRGTYYLGLVVCFSLCRGFHIATDFHWWLQQPGFSPYVVPISSISIYYSPWVQSSGRM